MDVVDICSSQVFHEIVEVHSSRRRLIGHHLDEFFSRRQRSSLRPELGVLRSQLWKMPLEHYIFAILILGKTMRHTPV